jgi:ribosomal protein L37AE/L43A
MNDAPTDLQMDKPFCPKCGLPMQLSHLEPTMQPEDHVVWRCSSCGETLEKVSLGESGQMT